MLSLRTTILLAGLAITTGCPASTLPEIGVEEVEPVVYNTAPIEAEPQRELPPIVATPLPELEPTRPLAHLAPLWRHVENTGPLPTTYVAIGETPVAMTPSDAQALGLSEGVVDLARLESSRWVPSIWAGPIFVLHAGTSFAGATRSSELAWVTPDTAVSYTSAISPRMLIASLYESERDRLIAWALVDGREQWQRYGELDFNRIRKLWVEGEQGYLLGDLGLVAFDSNTGATRWTSALATNGCGVVTKDAIVVIEDPSGHHIVEAATGDPIARLPVLESMGCGWGSYDADGVAQPVILDDTLLVFEGLRDDGTVVLHAFDLATRTERWRVSGFDGQVLAVDHDAVYVSRDLGVVALDLATGTQQAAIAVGSRFSLTREPVGGAAGPLLVVTDEWGTWVLGRAELAPKPESFAISGQLVATGPMDPTRIAGVRVRVGDQIVKTDKRGRFSAKGTAIGAIVVESAADPYGYDYDGAVDGYPPIMLVKQRVMLEGGGRYDLGRIDAYELSVA